MAFRYVNDCDESAGAAQAPAFVSPDPAENLPQPRDGVPQSAPGSLFSAQTLQALQESADSGAGLESVQDLGTAAPGGESGSMVPAVLLGLLYFAATR